MKKLISACLLFVLIFSLCASASALTPEELYEKYAPLIDALEAQDFDAAGKALGDFLPEIEYEPVELTEENFYDFFEIFTDEPNIYRYSTGKIKEIFPGNPVIKLKEEYYTLLNWEKSSASFKVQAKKTPYRAKINFETGAVKLGDKASDSIKKAIKNLEWYESKINTTVDMSEGGGFYTNYYLGGDGFYYKDPQYSWWNSGSAEPDSGAKYYQIAYSDFKVSDVKGTLYMAPAPAEEG